jgi:2-polyprenyl-6-methoxyphenol hydroxylase-like FAD-dependent oxidoreductase
MAHVVIVGAGPGGALLAHLLAQRGVEVTLLERQSDFAREFRGEVLMPSGVDALEQAGLASAMASVPRYAPPEFEIFLNRRSVVSAELDPDFFEGRPPIALSQPGLLEVLVCEAAKAPGFRLERGASVKDLVREAGRIVGVRARTRFGQRRALRAGRVFPFGTAEVRLRV